MTTRTRSRSRRNVAMGRGCSRSRGRHQFRRRRAGRKGVNRGRRRGQTEHSSEIINNGLPHRSRLTRRRTSTTSTTIPHSTPSSSASSCPTEATTTTTEVCPSPVHRPVQAKASTSSPGGPPSGLGRRPRWVHERKEVVPWTSTLPTPLHHHPSASASAVPKPSPWATKVRRELEVRRRVGGPTSTVEGGVPASASAVPATSWPERMLAPVSSSALRPIRVSTRRGRERAIVRRAPAVGFQGGIRGRRS
jgi:hypothetical protein